MLNSLRRRNEHFSGVSRVDGDTVHGYFLLSPPLIPLFCLPHWHVLGYIQYLFDNCCEKPGPGTHRRTGELPLDDRLTEFFINGSFYRHQPVGFWLGEAPVPPKRLVSLTTAHQRALCCRLPIVKFSLFSCQVHPEFPDLKIHVQKTPCKVNKWN